MRDHHRLPGRSICRPPRSRRTGRSATSREVSRIASLRRSLAAPFRLGGDRPPDHPAPAFVRASALPTPCRHRGVRTRPCGFWRLASPGDCIEYSWRRRPRGSFVAAFPSAHVPGPQPELLSRPGRAHFRVRRRPLGFAVPFAVSIPPAVGRRLVDAGRPHMPFRRRAVRECTLARSDRYVGTAGRGGCGSWVRPRTRCATSLAGPA